MYVNFRTNFINVRYGTGVIHILSLIQQNADDMHSVVVWNSFIQQQLMYSLTVNQ